jgi:hypothetical protein
MKKIVAATALFLVISSPLTAYCQIHWEAFGILYGIFRWYFLATGHSVD